MLWILGQTAAEAAKGFGSWAEYGLAGMVILAQFTVLGLLIRWAIQHIDKVHESHRGERDLWREAMQSNADRMVASIDKLTDRIQGHG